MKKQRLDDKEVVADWRMLGVKHRQGKAAAIRRYCVGRSVKEVARLIDCDPRTVQELLTWSGMQDAGMSWTEAIEGAGIPPPLAESTTVRDVREVVKAYAPSEPDVATVADYEVQGYSSDVSRRLATAYEATEAAIETGQIRESSDREEQRFLANPKVARTMWGGSLLRICRRVKDSARELDDAKISDLKDATTLQQVMAAHDRWMEQIERLRNLHDEVSTDY
jgi:hypothetical protein